MHLLFIDDVLLALIGIQVLSLLVAFVRFVWGPTLADRIVAYDLIATNTIGMLALASVVYSASVLLDVAAVLALVMFISTIAFARYIERKPERDAMNQTEVRTKEELADRAAEQTEGSQGGQA
jgi:multicomponent Na+:H+ antiporter subunit F